jgi:phosphinothricin acetyltransferase
VPQRRSEPWSRSAGARRCAPRLRRAHDRIHADRAGRRTDAAAIAAIYDDAARNSAATFDLAGKPESWWRDAIADVDPTVGRLVLVAVDARERVLGYAKSGEHRPRAAYASTCETSLYVAAAQRGLGVGGALYDALLGQLDESPLRLAVAGMTEPNEASARLHSSRGFTPVGRFSGIGAKRGRAWDVTWYQRRLATPALVEELRALVSAGGGPREAAEAIRGRGGYQDARLTEVPGAGVPIVDPRTGRPLAAIATGDPLRPSDRLLLEWCAEALAPLFAR